MTDNTELKRLAELLHGAEWQLVDGDGFDADNRFVTSQQRIDDNKVAFAEINYGHPEAGMGEPFQSEQVTAGEFIAAANPAAVLALIAENERLERLAESRLLNWEAEGRALLEACSDRNQLKAENEALYKDAERYRWLRLADWWRSPICAIRNPKEQAKLGSDCPSGERLDEAVDAAMGKGEQA